VQIGAEGEPGEALAGSMVFESINQGVALADSCVEAE